MSARVKQTTCSTVDAAIWKFTLDTTPSNWVLGHIARPTYGCSPGPCSPVNLQIGSYFRINATQDSIPIGALVSMIGQKTGWNQDYVQKLCQYVAEDATHGLVCQDFATYGNDFGDSGAPILMNINLLPDSSATLAGIHNGVTKGSRYAIFSTWSHLAIDYPGLVVF